MGIDLKDILRIAKPVAKGAIAAKVGLMAKEREREDTAIEEAECINANTVQTGIQTAQTDLANTKTIQNEKLNNLMGRKFQLERQIRNSPRITQAQKVKLIYRRK